MSLEKQHKHETHTHTTKKWVSIASSREDRGPLVLGLAHTLHGLTLWSTPRQRALFREATMLGCH